MIHFGEKIRTYHRIRILLRSSIERQIELAEEFTLIPKRTFISKKSKHGKFFWINQYINKKPLSYHSNTGIIQILSRAVKRIQDADPSTDRLITRAKSTGCGKREPDDVILELFVGHDSEI